MSALLPPLDTLVVWLAAGAAFVTVLALWQAFMVRDPLGARVRELAARRASLRNERIVPRTPLRLGLMRQVVRRLNLLRGKEALGAADKLAQAGLRGRDALVVFLFARLAAPLAAGAAAMIGLRWLHIVTVPPNLELPLALAMVLAGACAPHLYLRNRTQKRRHELRKALPDALDLLVICAEAGLGLDAALQRVSREVGRGASAMADELALTGLELGFLADRRQALDNLNRRTGLVEMRALINTLAQTEKYGTPLAQSLRVLSSEYRDQRMMRAEEKAARLPAIMTVPMIVFIMPALFVVLIGPAIMRTLDALRGL